MSFRYCCFFLVYLSIGQCHSQTFAPLRTPENEQVATISTAFQTVFLTLSQQAPLNVTVEKQNIPLEDIRIRLNITGTTDRDLLPIVDPRILTLRAGQEFATFTLEAGHSGRFYLHYELLNVPSSRKYKLSDARTVVLVSSVDEGWRGLLYQFLVNFILFGVGMLYFVWRRVHRTPLPFWRGHEEGLFQRIHPTAYEAGVLMAEGNFKQRFETFCRVHCDGTYVASTSGIEAALNLRFHLDMAVYFTVLGALCLFVLIPVNILAGEAYVGKELFHSTTISNVPIRSKLLWFHVFYCYIAAIGVYMVLRKQFKLLFKLLKRTRRSLGARSVFIRAGLPRQVTAEQLKEALHSLFPDAIEEVVVLSKLGNLYSVLQRRLALQDEYERLKELTKLKASGRMPCCLQLLPGGAYLPSITESISAWFCCIPCRTCCWATTSSENDNYLDMDALESQILKSKWESPEAHRLSAVKKEMDSFATETVNLYEKRHGTGAAFIQFKTVQAKMEFMNMCKERSLYSKSKAFFRAIFKGRMRESIFRVSLANQRFPYLVDSLLVQTAPEPADLKWSNLTVRPYARRRILLFFVINSISIVLLLIFSTPTIVLRFLQLDASSTTFKSLRTENTVFMMFIANYLPALLLILVNWLLLNSLFYLSEFEPWHTYSSRMQSFMRKGFSYLLLSSIVLPSIGVSAVFIFLQQWKTTRENSVEQFLYKMSGIFFITYICQRTFLGAVVQLLRLGERFFYQPWLLSRAVTEKEINEAKKPWPYYFGNDYAVILSVFMVALSGSVFTPMITPFGALYFYLKFVTTKYNFLYVMEYTPGRGNIARTGYNITIICVLLFEFAMVFVFREIGDSWMFIAMVLLFTVTLIVVLIKSNAAQKFLSQMEHHDVDQESLESIGDLIQDIEESEPIELDAKPAVADDAQNYHFSYRNPYEELLALYVLNRKQLQRQQKAAFLRWKEHAKAY